MEEQTNENSQDNKTSSSSGTGFNFCPGCGHELKQPARFCSQCGRPLVSNAGPVRPDVNVEAVPGDEDFIAFIGNNAQKYLYKFKGFNTGGVDNFSVTWNWSAFFGGIWWLLYRKLYVWALICFIMMFIHYLNLVAWIGLGAAGNYIYYRHAKGRILELRELDRQGDISAALAHTGGVNTWIPVVALLITALLIIFGVFAGFMSCTLLRPPQFI